ncbi:hypothetical protein ACU686_03535 [Yinghuangia aomiensis]
MGKVAARECQQVERLVGDGAVRRGARPRAAQQRFEGEPLPGPRADLPVQRGPGRKGRDRAGDVGEVSGEVPARRGTAGPPVGRRGRTPQPGNRPP